MGNKLKAKVTVRGVRPLLWCHFGDDAIPLEPGEKTGRAGNDPEEWRRTVLVTKAGQLYVEPTYVFGCIRDGARNVKQGKGSISKVVAATLQVTDNAVLFPLFMPGANGSYDVKAALPPPRDPTLPVYLDVRGVVNPNSRARNIRYRVAAAPGWETTFNLLWDKTVVNRDLMKAAVIEAGSLSGLGDGRSIGFGRFEVIDFEVVDA